MRLLPILVALALATLLCHLCHASLWEAIPTEDEPWYNDLPAVTWHLEGQSDNGPHLSTPNVVSVLQHTTYGSSLSDPNWALDPSWVDFVTKPESFFHRRIDVPGDRPIVMDNLFSVQAVGMTGFPIDYTPAVGSPIQLWGRKWRIESSQLILWYADAPSEKYYRTWGLESYHLRNVKFTAGVVPEPCQCENLLLTGFVIWLIWRV